MIKGNNILCFGSEKWEYPGFQQTLMQRLSSLNKIIFVNPIGSRTPKLQWTQARKVAHRVSNLFVKKNLQTINLKVCTPWTIPLVYNTFITNINKRIIKHQLNLIMARNNFTPTILWIGTPTAAFTIDLFRPELIVYHAVDRFSKFSFVNGIKIKTYEKVISEKADLVLCTSDAIKRDLIKYNDAVYTITHAVDFDHF